MSKTQVIVTEIETADGGVEYEVAVRGAAAQDWDDLTCDTEEEAKDEAESIAYEIGDAEVVVN